MPSNRVPTTISRTTAYRTTAVAGARPRAGRATRVVVALVGVVALAASLTGCSVVDEIRREPQRHYAAYADTPSRSDTDERMWFLPDWVPDDATDIDIRQRPATGGYVIRFTSAHGVDTTRCTPLDGRDRGPTVRAAFLPSRLPDHGRMTCGDGRTVLHVEDAWYGWAASGPAASGPAASGPAATPAAH